MTGVRFNVADLTLGEIERVEDATGVVFSTVLGAPVPAKVVAAVVWVREQRTNPAFTLDDAKAVKLTELSYGPDEDGVPVDPTPPVTVDGHGNDA